MRILLWTLILGLMSTTATALAQVKSISVAAGGVWCTSCTYRLEKAIQRLDGVQKVRAQVQPPRAEVTPRSGVWVEAERLRSAVKSAGFKSGDVWYTVTGTLIQWQNQPALRLSGTERVFLLQPDPKAPKPYERIKQALPDAEGKVAEVEGRFVEHAVAEDRQSPATPQILRLEIRG
jgi:copper chaperone CopZ